MQIEKYESESDFNNGTYANTEYDDNYNGVIPKQVWEYYKQITVSNFSSNYQIKITVHAGSGTDDATNVYLNNHCQNFPNDFKFMESDLETKLGYYIESADENSAQVWIKLPETSQNVYIVYGNTADSSESDADEVFIFYESAESGNPLSKWTEPSGVGEGRAYYTTDQYKYGSQSLAVEQTNNGESPYIIIADIEPDSNFIVALWKKMGQANGKGRLTAYEDGDEKVNTLWNETGDLKWYNGSTEVDTTYNYTTDWEYFNYIFILSTNQVQWKRDSTVLANDCHYDTFTSIDQIRIQGGNIANTQYFDAVYIRKYEATPPTFSFGSETQVGITKTYTTNLVPDSVPKKFIACFVEGMNPSGTTFTLQILDSGDTLIETINVNEFNDIRDISEKIKIKATLEQTSTKTPVITNIFFSYIPNTLNTDDYKLGDITIENAEIYAELNTFIKLNRLKKSEKIVCDHSGPHSQTFTINFVLTSYTDINKLLALLNTETTFTAALTDEFETYDVYIENVSYNIQGSGDSEADAYYVCTAVLRVIE